MPVQAWGPQPSGDCAGLRGMAQWNRDGVCVCIAGLAGLRAAGQQSGDLAGLCRPERHSPVEIVQVWGVRVWGIMALAGLRSGSKDLRSHALQSNGSVGLWGRAWCAAPAILLVYCGLEKPSIELGGSECWCYSFLWCFTSAKYVSSLSAKSLVHGAQEVCGCVPVAILDLSVFSFFTQVP
jgi:hypothetical protein